MHHLINLTLELMHHSSNALTAPLILEATLLLGKMGTLHFRRPVAMDGWRATGLFVPLH